MKYLLTIVNDESQAMPENQTPEQLAEMMEPWNNYNQELIDAGAFVACEAIQRSENATTVRFAEGDQTVTDGPFAETKEQLGGFYLIECGDLDEALAWAKKVPTRPGNAVEVWPAMDFTQFGYEDPYVAAGKA